MTGERSAFEGDVFYEHDVEYNNATKSIRMLANSFSKEMKEKMLQKFNEGRRGWDDPAWTVEDVKKALIDHIEKGDPVDIANFAAFWWYKQRDIS